MRRSAALVLMIPLLAGCVSQDTASDASNALDIYAFEYPGSDVFVPGAEAGHGRLFRVANPGGEPVEVRGCTPGAWPVTQGPAATAMAQEGTRAMPCSAAFLLGPGDSVAYVVQVFGMNGTVRMQFFADGQPAWGQQLDIRSVQTEEVPLRSHVKTSTVGVWTNGTSFYTNIPSLLQDPAFPAGGNVDRNDSLAAAAPLAVYVYENDRNEQPPASRDTCHFTTIGGYNGLLLDQAASLTSVRYLHPAQAYTVAGAEGHFLYGEAIVFLNTVVSIDEVTDASFTAPETNGDCHDPQNTLDYFGIPAESPVLAFV